MGETSPQTRTRWQRIWPSTRLGWAALVSVWLEALIVIGLDAAVYGIFQSDNADAPDVLDAQRKGLPVYLILFILTQVFQIYLCWDAVLHKNTIQMIGFVCFSYCAFAYSIFQYFQITRIDNLDGMDLLRPLLISIASVAGVFSLLYTYFAFKLYLEFGWKIYKKIGADPRMRAMYRSYQIMMMLLKLDVFFFLAFSAQFLCLVLKQNDPEFALTIAALPIAVIIIVLAVYGLRREDKLIMIVFMFGLLLAIAYFIFKLVRMHEPDQQYKYVGSVQYLTFFSVLTLMCVVATFAYSIVCYLNFGKGLKPLLNRRRADGAATRDVEERLPFEE